MRARLAMVLVGVLVATAGCTAGADDGPVGKPVEFSAKPVWSSERLGFQRVRDVTIRGDVMLAAGDRARGGARLVAVDPATGAVRWSVDHEDRLLGGGGVQAYGEPGLVGATGRVVVTGGAEPVVLIQYHVRGVRPDNKYSYEAERGVAALAVKDGRVRWKTPTFQAAPAAAPAAGREPETSVVVADDRVAVVTTMPGTNNATVDDAKTAAYAVADGRKLWEQAGWWPYLLADGTLLGEADTRAGKTPWRGESSTRKGTVVAVDALTGAKRWDLAKRYTSSELKVAARGLAVVGTEDDERKVRTLVIDAANGREVGNLGDYTDCNTDGSSLIACLDVGDSILRTFRVSDRRIEVSDRGVFRGNTYGNSVDAVWEGRIFVSGVPSDSRKQESVTVDHTAHRLGGKLPGAVAAISGKYVVFRQPGGDSLGFPGFAVHRVGAASPPADKAAPPAPVRFDKSPLWTVEVGRGTAEAGFGLRRVDSFRVAGDAVVAVGADRTDGGDRLVVADATSGVVRWAIGSGAEVGGDGTTVAFYSSPDVVQVGADQLVLLVYEKQVGARRVEEGLAALSLKDGSLRWRVPLRTGPQYEVHVSARTANGQLALLEIWRTDRRKGASSNIVESRTVAIDLRTHRKRWEAPGVKPWDVVGDTVVGTVPKLPYEVGSRSDGVAVGLDAATGKRRWDLAKRHATSRFVAAVGTVAVVGTEDGAAVVDVASGRERVRIGKELSSCRNDGQGLIACRAGGESMNSHLVTVQVTGDTTPQVTQLLAVAGVTPTHVLRKWIFASSGDRAVVVDAVGTPRDGDLPGQLAAESDRLAVFASGGEYPYATRYVAYRVLG